MSGTADEAPIRKALWGSLAFITVVAVAGAAWMLWLGSGPEETVIDEHRPQGPQAIEAPDTEPPELHFSDISKTAGIDFVHENGAYGERMLPETMGGGVAFFDYDRDGNQDLLLVNSTSWPWRDEKSEATSHLYRNRGDGTFADVSVATGLDLALYGMGVATGDYDRDGWTDVFITAVGENRLLRNVDGDHFMDVTDTMNVAGAPDAWSASAAFFDYDRDGDLDLFVCNYVQWSPDINRQVDYRLVGIGRAYGPPTDFAGADSYLYRNDGNGFTDVSAEARIQVANETSGDPVGKALAVMAVDIDGDDWLDLVVANDTVRNFLFRNDRNGGFDEVGIEYGLAFDSAGLATGAMGIDAAHFANDDRLGITIGNFANEMSSFYVSRPGADVFSDDAIVTGIGAESRRALTFGTAFVDVDLDGRQDLIAANGHVEPEINQVQSSQRYPQPLQLFWNCGSDCTRQFTSVGAAAGLSEPRVGRGIAFADIDNDGDLDLAVTQVGGSFALLRNDQTLGNHWVRLVATLEDGSDAIGAQVTLTSGGATQVRTVMPSRSYLSQVELPMTFGLGDHEAIEEVRVRWPNGDSDVWPDLDIDQVHRLRKGEGPAR